MTHKIIMLFGLLLWGVSAPSSAFTVNILAGTPMIYLRIGDGSFSGNFSTGGTPQNNTVVNVVSVSVPATVLGNSVAQLMTSSATQTNSFYDGYAFCNLPNEVYVGGFLRRPVIISPQTAILSVTTPVALTNATGSTIPFAQIMWTASGNGDGTTAQPIPSGSFDSTNKTLATFARNTWNESCHKFYYKNEAFVDAGVYTGRATYTLVSP